MPKSSITSSGLIRCSPTRASAGWKNSRPTPGGHTRYAPKFTSYAMTTHRQFGNTSAPLNSAEGAGIRFLRRSALHAVSCVPRFGQDRTSTRRSEPIGGDAKELGGSRSRQAGEVDEKLAIVVGFGRL